MYRALLKTRQRFVQFCVTIEWRHTRDGNLMHTSCWEDKQTQGAILLLGGGDPVGCAANGSYVAGLHYILGIHNSCSVFRGSFFSIACHKDLFHLAKVSEPWLTRDGRDVVAAR